jgi:amidase
LRGQNRLTSLEGLLAAAAVAGSLTYGCSAPAPGSSGSVAGSPTSSDAFAIEEATIDGIHAAIRSGQTTCQAVVQAYIDRARAYNGVCTSLVTADGGDIPPASGAVRAGGPLTFPTKTTKGSTIFPDLDQYRGKPLDFGRMEPTVSDPTVMAQAGMRVGIPDVGQLNASGRSRARARSTSGRRLDRCRPERQQHARNSANNRTLSNAPPNWTRNTAAIPI